MRMSKDRNPHETFESLVCLDCAWEALSRHSDPKYAEHQALKHAERSGCESFVLKVVEARVVRAVEVDCG